jgi:periplasmic protein TonB
MEQAFRMNELDRNTPEPYETPPPRRPYRPPIGVPGPRDDRRTGILLSFALHALVILLLTAPVILARAVDVTPPEGAGGAGPAGGGGGGNRGDNGKPAQERLRFLRIAPPVASPAVEMPPVLPTPPTVTPPVETQQSKPIPEPSETALAPTGTGGSGSDGTAGMGPGSGGGTGSGVGTGTGSGTGPGTGGGTAEIHPPTLTQLALLPLPVPSKVRPYRMVASFDVDENGNAKLIGFNPSKDNGYNRRILEMLREIRFRPAVRGDGTPVRDTAVITAIAP